MSWWNNNKSCIRVDESWRASLWEFFQISCPGQTRTRVAWELTNESLYESFLNSHVLAKREQELQYMRVDKELCESFFQLSYRS